MCEAERFEDRAVDRHHVAGGGHESEAHLIVELEQVIFVGHDDSLANH